MSKMYLNGSANTGKKIMQYNNHFSYSYSGKEKMGDGTLYRFNWNFDFQHGIMSIFVRSMDGKISNSSLINTDVDTGHKFSRPLGLYNDESLLDVFVDALQSIGVTSNGAYSG